jgi:hypothetical protein
LEEGEAMQDRIFGDREKAIEEAYFRSEDAKLVEKLWQKAHLDEIATALGEKLQVDNPELLAKVRGLGVTLDTAPAFFLAPLVQVAWAEGKVPKAEHDAVLRIARRRGVEADSPAYAQLEQWLRARPSDEFFDTAVETIKVGFDVLPPAERDARIKDVVRACQEVADASAGLGRFFGLSDAVSPSEVLTLDDIAKALRSRE